MENWINTVITPQRNRRARVITPTSNRFQPLAAPDDNDEFNFNQPTIPVPAFDLIDSFIVGIAPERVASPTTPQPSATAPRTTITTTTTTNQNNDCADNHIMSLEATGLSTITSDFLKYCTDDIKRPIKNPNLTDVYDTRTRIGAVMKEVPYAGSTTGLSWIVDDDDMLRDRLGLNPGDSVPRPTPPKVVNIPSSADKQRTHYARTQQYLQYTN